MPQAEIREGDANVSPFLAFKNFFFSK